MDQYHYNKVLEQRLIPQLKDWFTNRDFIHDGAPRHKVTKKCKNTSIAWKQSKYERNRKSLDYYKEKVKEMQHHNKNDLIKRLIQIWYLNNKIQINCPKLIQKYAKMYEIFNKKHEDTY